MAFIRTLARLSSRGSRYFVTETVQIQTIYRHNSTTSFFTRHTKHLLPALFNPKLLNRSMHDDKTKTETIKANDKLPKDEKERTEGAADQNENQLTQVQKLKKVFADYGSIGLAFHVTISLTSLGICYTAVSSGLDVPSMLQKIGLSKGISDSVLTTGASTFVIAYACHKVFAPLRMFMTITCTPLIVRRLRSMGILKVPPKKTN